MGLAAWWCKCILLCLNAPSRQLPRVRVPSVCMKHRQQPPQRTLLAPVWASSAFFCHSAHFSLHSKHLSFFSFRTAANCAQGQELGHRV